VSTLEITSLPPIETIDPEKVKDFEKDQIKTYLEFYGSFPAPSCPNSIFLLFSFSSCCVFLPPSEPSETISESPNRYSLIEFLNIG
jgi:hypothetical protein